jgi:hypothetical protein
MIVMKLTPVKFNEQTTTLSGPKSQSDDFPKKVPVHLSREHNAYISRWKLGKMKGLSPRERRKAFWERLMFVLGYTSIWMVVYAKGHPPVYLTCEKSVFDNADDDD